MSTDGPRAQRGWKSVFDAWWLDLAVVVAALAAVLSFPPIWAALDLLGRLDLERRLGIYSDLITISSLLGGFSTLAFSAYIGWTGRGVDRVKRVIGSRLMVVWISSIATPWLAALAIGTAKIVDTGPAWTSNPSRWVALAAVVLVILSLARTVIIFAALADLKDNQGTPTKVLSAAPLAVPDRMKQRASNGR